MRFTPDLTLRGASNRTSSPAFFSTTYRSIDSSTARSAVRSAPSAHAIHEPASKTNDHGENRNISVPTPIGLKPSYLILDEDIPFPDAFRMLGRLVADVKCPLEEYTPSRVIRGAKIPDVDEASAVLDYNEDTLKRQSTSTSNTSVTTRSSPGSSHRILTDEADFAQKLEKYKPTLVFSNLPFTTSSSTTATITHRSQYSKSTNSLLTAMLGISISSSTTATTTYRLDSALIHTLSLTQHNLVWAALLGHDQYKQDIMTTVQRNDGKMFLVVGVKVAQDAEVQKQISRGREVSGKLQVDVGSGVGVQGFARVERIAGGKSGEGINMGVMGSQTNEVMDEGGRKERLLGDRAFAVEYREVRLKMKLEIGVWRGRNRMEQSQPAQPLPQPEYAHNCSPQEYKCGHPYPQRPQYMSAPSWQTYSATELPSGTLSSTDGGNVTPPLPPPPPPLPFPDYDKYDECDEYELELGEEVMVQEIDALW